MEEIREKFFKGNPLVQKLYEELRKELLEIDSQIVETPTKSYIGYKLGNKNLVSLNVFKDKLGLELNRVQPEDLDDPKGLVKYREFSLADKGRHISDLIIKSDSDVKYGANLVKQIYNKFFT